MTIENKNVKFSNCFLFPVNCTKLYFKLLLSRNVSKCLFICFNYLLRIVHVLTRYLVIDLIKVSANKLISFIFSPINCKFLLIFKLSL